MPNSNSILKRAQLAPAFAPFGICLQAAVARARRPNERFAYKGRPAARPAAPQKAAPPPPKQSPTPSQDAPKPPEPAKEADAGKAR